MTLVALHLPHFSPHMLSHPTKTVKLVFGGLMGFNAVLIGFAAFAHRHQTKHDVAAPGLYGVVGAMGRGKSYFLAWMAVQATKRRRVVFANYHLKGAVDYLDFRVQYPYHWTEWPTAGCWVTVWACGCRWGLDRFDCKEEVCYAPRGGARVFVPPGRDGGWTAFGQAPYGSLALLDEVHTWWPSHAWRAPDWLMAWCSQLRKRRLTVVWASQHFTFIAKRLVLLTFAIWTCERYRRGHRYTLFEAVGFGTAKAIRLSRMNVVRKAEVMQAYDTGEIVGGAVEWADSAQEQEPVA